MMEIYSIKWNSRVVATSHMGTVTGSKLDYDYCSVSEHLRDSMSCKKILEITPSIYDIYLWNNAIKRVFNPIEVMYKNNT